MTKQTLREYRTDITGCDKCNGYKQTALFELCTHPKSVYHGADLHTCQHMREIHVGACGPDRKLFVKK